MTKTPEAHGADPSKSGVAVAVVFLITLVFFWPTLASFPGTWADYGRSHGWLVAGLVGWLVWRDRRELVRGIGGNPWILTMLAAFSLLWFAATVAHIQVFHQTILLFLLICWGLVVFGGRALRTLLVAGATFLLALPLWDVLVPILRPLTTLASGAMVLLLGVPAEIEGDLVRIPAGSFIIADGCAGLNYLLAGLVVGAFYAHLLVRGWPAKLGVVALAGAIAIVGNWIRVAGVIVIGHATEMQSGLVERHLGFGWVIFTLGLVPFFLLARIIEKRADRRYAGSEPESAGVDAEADTGEPKAGSRRLVSRAAAASAVAIVGPLLYFGIGAMPAVDSGERGLEELARSDPWRIAESPPERPFDWRPAYRRADQHDSLAFTDGERIVYGDRFVYRKQAQGAKLIGFPNRIAPSSAIYEERLMGPVDPDRGLWVQQAVVITPEGPVLVWYWYRVGGVDTFSPVYAKILEVPAFLSRRRASELMALSAACEADNCREAFEALLGFMGVQTAATAEPTAVPNTTEPAQATGGPSS